MRYPPTAMRGDAYRDAQPMSGFVNDATGELDPAAAYRPSGTEFHVEKGSLLRVINNGAGGWGSPLRREPARVLRDVRDGYVSIAGAARDYGVVVRGDPERDPEGLAIDEGATRQLRGEMEKRQTESHKRRL
jgi:N-methylhydantoinase B